VEIDKKSTRQKTKIEIQSSKDARFFSENWGTLQHTRRIPYGSIL